MLRTHPLAEWISIAATAAVIVFSSPVWAGLVLEPGRDPAESVFDNRLHAALERVRGSPDPLIRELYLAAVAAPATIRIRPITSDRTTWHPDGDRKRAHVEAEDGRPRGIGRSVSTAATVFVPRDAVEPGSAHWKNGVLVHELVHAVDLAYGRYNRDYTVRERRAVFIQNMWRERIGFRLRTAYHGRFATLDYQHAKSRGMVAAYGRYITSRADFPPPPPTRRVDRHGED